jgi:hypothetical protein
VKGGRWALESYSSSSSNAGVKCPRPTELTQQRKDRGSQTPRLGDTQLSRTRTTTSTSTKDGSTRMPPTPPSLPPSPSHCDTAVARY